MSLKEIASILGVLILGFGLGCYYTNSRAQADLNNVDTSISQEILQPEYDRIDSLENIILAKEKLIDQLSDSVKVITITKTVEIDRVSALPLDSAALYLEEKLKEYENNF